MAKVLVVEDDKLILEMVSKAFTDTGYDVCKAENGEEGLEKAREFVPNIIILDIVMPKMDGITMLGRLRETEWGKDTPVIILTSQLDSEKISETMSNKVFKYIIKSDFDIQNLLESARILLSNS